LIINHLTKKTPIPPSSFLWFDLLFVFVFFIFKTPIQKTHNPKPRLDLDLHDRDIWRRRVKRWGEGERRDGFSGEISMERVDGLKIFQCKYWK
jgi:hypothetical protein